MDCAFCTLPPQRILIDYPLIVAIRDAYPVSQGHTLILPKRHIQSFFDLSEAERDQLFRALHAAKELLTSSRPDGFNIGINDGPAAGQTVPHLHLHLIPRYLGDSTDPRGGVRWVLPEKARYWAP